MSGQWNASWIGPHEWHPSTDTGVFAFRRVFHLSAAAETFHIQVSADQRYKLYCNGQFVGFGPQRGDEKHWFYESYDLAPFLEQGENVLLALVWNFGFLAPMAQHTVRTGFVLEGEEVSTGPDWQVLRLDGWQYRMMHSNIGDFYIDVGPGEVIDAREIQFLPLPRSGRGRLGGGFTDSEGARWQSPHVICTAEDRGAMGGGTPWMLIPRSIPLMRYELRSQPAAVQAEWPGPGTLLDFGELLCAYPRLTAAGRTGTEVTLTYAESLWNPDGTKGNRDEVTGKDMRGYQDKFILSDEVCTFEPLWWRTFRYVLVEGTGGFTLDVVETGYRLETKSSFEADDPWVKPIWDVSVRTAERCAGETYFDCPYYEQLQYAGDTRIQALIGYYLSQDRLLQRNAIETLGWSATDHGLTQSRYPSRQAQVIPPFSLWWVLMLHDQWLYDSARSNHLGLDHQVSHAWTKILCYDEESSFWNFADWVPDWRWGVPPGDGLSTMHQLTYLLVRLSSSRRYDYLGREPDRALQQAKKVLQGESQFMQEAGLWKAKDDPDWQPNEHSEALMRCAQIMVGLAPDAWPTDALEAAGAAKTTYYFSYYKHLAKRPIDYMAELAPWKEMIESGLTTFAENPEPSRSDCHAWSAHPILGFFQVVAGVTSVAPAWTRARVEPNPGSLRRFDARIDHPDGELRVRFEDERLHIDTPVPTELAWLGREAVLQPGSHEI